MGCDVGCGVGCGGTGGVSDSSKLFSPKISPPKYPKYDDSRFELDGLAILTQIKTNRKTDRPSQSVCQSLNQALYHSKWRLGKNPELSYF